ncbi:ABC-type multidrug transport system, ATPase and permease component [Marinitoga piezophila KA3]|uniref:ABC-type multidrug transport system, ATPase and permease component n=1 Tax=Marinitoga piezophila (strain DSM 14283 / JCM 11233 / KA3) TaxID=443254 RepID=H2J3L9_MARPK|nr:MULTISPECIES: ABC transporter ATP-binding protein [Marinitoga]AEX84663.1 ABC-type multidrug transport system, ATPase and permease component [Marinitoga piezophila KA3]
MEKRRDDNKLEKKEIYNFLFKIFKRYWKRQIIAILFIGLMAISALVFPMLIKYMIDVVIPEKNFQILFKYIFIMIGVLIATSVISYLGEIIFEMNALIAKRDIRKEIIIKLTKLPYEFFMKINSGELISKLMSDLEMVGVVVSQVFPVFVLSILQIAGIIGMMFYLNWKLAMVPIILTIISLLILKIINKKAEHISIIEREKFGEITNLLVDIINNIKTIKVMNVYSWTEEMMDTILYNHYNVGKKFIKFIKLSGAIGNSINGLITVGVFGYGGYLIIKNEITLGTLIAFWTFIQTLMSPLQLLMKVNMVLRSSWGGIKRIVDITKYEEEKVEEKKIENINSIQLENIEYGFNNEKILETVNLNLQKGKIICITGENGVGKTTLFNVITGLYIPKKGKIKLNDKETIESNILRKHIGYVEQEPVLFKNCSIKENILMGRKISKEKFEEILKITDLEKIISKFENGIEEKVQNINLSGGQKQMIAIARALISEPQIILLDEFTSAMDAKNEEIIHEILKKLKKEGKIIVLITHRKSTLEICDEKLKIEKGELEKLTDKNLYY